MPQRPKGRIKEIAHLIIRVWRENRGVILAGSLITSSNRETRIVPMYHEVRSDFAGGIIIDQATGRNTGGGSSRSKPRRSPFSRRGTLVVPCNPGQFPGIVYQVSRSNTVFNSLSAMIHLSREFTVLEGVSANSVMR